MRIHRCMRYATTLEILDNVGYQRKLDPTHLKALEVEGIEYLTHKTVLTLGFVM